MISVDTKKKELVGNFKNGGREWHPAGEPELVSYESAQWRLCGLWHGSRPAQKLSVRETIMKIIREARSFA